MATVITITENGDVSINQKSGTDVNKEEVSNGSPICHDLKLEEEEDSKQKKKVVSVFEIFRFATSGDIIMLVVGTLAGIGHGMALPALIIVFGLMIDSFVDTGKYIALVNEISPLLMSVGIPPKTAIVNPNLLLKHIPDIKTNYTFLDTSVIQRQVDDDFLEVMETYALYYVGMAFAVLLLTFLQVVCWMLPAERQIKRIRRAYFRNVLRQEIGWFDVHESGQINTRLSSDINNIHEGIGDKISTFFQWISTTLTAFIVSFIYGWKLSIVILSVAPLVALSSGIMTKVLENMSSKELLAYAKAGAIAEEVIGSIRTVFAFGGQRKECERYKHHLGDARDIGIKKSLGNGISFGILYLIIFCADALGFWYGSKLTREEPETYSIGNVLIIFFGIVVGAIAFGNAMPNLQSFTVARGAAYDVFKLIDLVPSIDSSSDTGLKPETLQGSVGFKNVTFRYPSRKDVQVLKGVNFEVRRGQTVALVGNSGCGKSTIVQLIQRLYDVESGQIFIDGVNIKEFNVKWLRQHIGIVSQEPVLFATTISDNIRYGKDDVTQEEIERAAKMANAHDFICGLPEKYETLVGERGAQLSGGQKQRIAIARALVRDPKILLLDEATSSLDTESEVVVQLALEKARAGRTTLVIAHRLSTIKTADTIIGMKDCVIVENGNHYQLMHKGGVYATLVNHQTNKDYSNEDEDESGNMIKKKVTHFIGEAVKKLEEDSDKDGKRDKKEKGVFVRLMKLNSPEWYFIFLGCLGSVAFGAVQPAFAVIFSSIVDVYASTDLDYQEKEINKFVIILVGLAVGSLVAITLQGYMFGKSGELLTLRLRHMTFKAILRQDIAYFDDPKNATGILITRLATEASVIHGAAGARVGKVLENISSIGTALIIGFIYGWQLTLLILAFIPFLILAGALEFRLLSGVAGKNKKSLESAGKIAMEGIDNIRTVAALSREKTILDLYMSRITGPTKQAIRKSFYIGSAFAFAQSVVFFLHAAGFYYGAWLVRESHMEFSDVFKVFAAIVFGAMAMGQASAFAPDVSKARLAAVNMFQLLDRVPVVDVESNKGEKLSVTEYSSTVTFKNVSFRYPTRPETDVLAGINLSVAPRQTVALVGTSGCGKSTVMQLIQRFYDPEGGEVRIGSCDIRKLNIQALRSRIGIVSQEPVLFDCSIAENIAYGDNERAVDMQEIVSAARSANIHDFIASLPNGYETNVGSKGTQLSGGQKQRVAIARALVRNPKILLLDEATSALDTKSEKIVQEALDKAREGRTCIVIAHRLSTIRNADKICVIRHGQVVEQGRHADLMARQSVYFKLHQIQDKIQ